MKRKGNAHNAPKVKKDLTPARARREKWKGQAIALYLKGYSQQEVTRRMKDETGGHSFSIATIHKYIHEAIDQWKANKAELVENYKAIELEKINRLEMTYWDAWEASKKAVKSKGERQMKTDDGGKALKETTKSERESQGDPRFLLGLQWCVEQRCKILGVEIPQIQINNNNGEKAGSTTNIYRRVVFKSRELVAAPQSIQEEETEEK